MKFTPQVTAGLLSLALLTAASAEDAVKFNVPGAAPAAPAAKPATPAPIPAPKTTAPAPAASVPAATPAAAPAAAAPVKYSDDQLMEAYGYIFVLQTRMASQLQALEISPAQKEAMVRGISMALAGKELPYDPEQVQTQLQDFMGKRQEIFLGKLKAQQTAAATEYFAKLKENKNVVELPSGLRYEIIKAGTGPVAKPGQVVTIHYTGALATGQVFESSRQRGQPVDLLLQNATPQSPQGVIAGMFEGLQKTGVGGQLKLHIPASLAYGDEGNSGIPPGAALVFDVDIIAAKDAPPAPATPAAPAAK
ncbi:MAG TPA: FKBP-type peptidyl-prolyl cis-trans isomerase [Lacunisphaera sp.]|nr:FKBP-type peptidyl-prolyl cis-trans isomerase [Lacunisphaera sp.]